MRYATQPIISRQVVEACFVAGTEFARLAALATVDAVAVVLLAPVALLAALALTAYGVAVLAYREIVPHGQDARAWAAVREMWGWIDAEPRRGGLGEARLAAAIAAGECDPTDAGQVVAAICGVPILRPITTPGYGDERLAPSMADTLRIAGMPEDAYILPEFDAPAVLPIAPPAPKRRATRKAAAPKPRTVKVMPSAAQMTPEPMYLRRAGGRYSKVGGRIQPKPGEALYRHEPTANGGRGGYLPVLPAKG